MTSIYRRPERQSVQAVLVSAGTYRWRNDCKALQILFETLLLGRIMAVHRHCCDWRISATAAMFSCQLVHARHIREAAAIGPTSALPVACAIFRRLSSDINSNTDCVDASCFSPKSSARRCAFKFWFLIRRGTVASLSNSWYGTKSAGTFGGLNAMSCCNMGIEPNRKLLMTNWPSLVRCLRWLANAVLLGADRCVLVVCGRLFLSDVRTMSYLLTETTPRQLLVHGLVWRRCGTVLWHILSSEPYTSTSSSPSSRTP
jgi:hypothetical protein